MNKPRFYLASDYAGLDFKGGGFYYGYEVSVCDKCHKQTPNGSEYCDVCEDSDREWCFSAKFDGNEVIIPCSKLQADDMFDVMHNLMMGIGWILAKYKLSIGDK